MSSKAVLSPADALAQLFTAHYGTEPEALTLLPVSGSDRRYFRLTAKGITCIGTYNNNVAENNSYFYFTELFRKYGIRVPELYRTSNDRKAYLQEDAGNTSLFDKLMQEGLTEGVRRNYHSSLEQLAKVQWIAGQHADFKQCYATARFDEKAILADLQYFKYYFADLQKAPYDRLALTSEMEELSKVMGRTQPQTLMYRDFQSRNILLQGNEVFFIDYQGAMQGPPQYDIASLLWQAKAQLPAAWREDLFNGYVASLKDLKVQRVDEIHFRKNYAQMVLLRLIQVLGAYGFRGLLERKPHFISSIGPALNNLEGFLNDYPQLPAYPALRSLLERLSAPDMQAKYRTVKATPESKLKVTVCSFSYKNGIPKSGGSHGGGYVFDCRGLLNPGRYAAYKHLTGMDEPVKQFLETETKMPEFIAHATGMVALNVEDYLVRGFEQLSVCFGCTGGQHRSVYAAEHMAKFLRSQYGLDVEAVHLNSEKWVREEA